MRLVGHLIEGFEALILYKKYTNKKFYKKYKYKTVNLVTNTLGWLEEMFSVNGRRYVIRHVLILQIFGTSKKLCFW